MTLLYFSVRELFVREITHLPNYPLTKLPTYQITRLPNLLTGRFSGRREKGVPAGITVKKNKKPRVWC
jgi:hypothetical protein